MRFSSDASEHRERVINKLGCFVSTSDPQGLVKEIHDMYKSSTFCDDITTSSLDYKLGMLAAQLCIGTSGINTLLGCDMFDLLHNTNSKFTEGGYYELLHQCLSLRDHPGVSLVYRRMTTKGIHIRTMSQQRLLSFLLKSGDVQGAIEAAWCTRHMSSGVVVALAEPLFLAGREGDFIELFQHLAGLSCSDPTALPLQPAELANVVTAALWARGRRGPRPGDPTLLVRLLQAIRAFRPAHINMANAQVMKETCELAERAVIGVFSNEPMARRTEIALTSLRRHFMSLSGQTPFPFLLPQDWSVSLPSDLSSEVDGLLSSRGGGNVLLCQSLWPEQYQDEMMCLTNVERVSGGRGRDDLYCDDELEEDQDYFDSDGDEGDDLNIMGSTDSGGGGGKRGGIVRPHVEEFDVSVSESGVVVKRIPGKGQGSGAVARAVGQRIGGVVSALLRSGALRNRNGKDEEGEEGEGGGGGVSGSDSDSSESDKDEGEEEEGGSDSDDDSDSEDDSEDEEEVEVALHTADMRSLLLRLDALGADHTTGLSRGGEFPVRDLSAQLEQYVSGVVPETTASSWSPPRGLRLAGDIFGVYSAQYVSERGYSNEAFEGLARLVSPPYMAEPVAKPSE